MRIKRKINKEFKKELQIAVISLSTIHSLTIIMYNILECNTGDIKEGDILSLSLVIEKLLYKEKNNIDMITAKWLGV